MLCRKIISPCSENHMKHTNTLCEQNAGSGLLKRGRVIYLHLNLAQTMLSGSSVRIQKSIQSSLIDWLRKWLKKSISKHVRVDKDSMFPLFVIFVSLYFAVVSPKQSCTISLFLHYWASHPEKAR
jgi:hypothetical protein